MKTSSWFTPMPADHIKIGISRGVPRRIPAGYRVFKTLAPGPWFNSVSDDEYLRLYRLEVLDKLDPYLIAAKLNELAGGRTPVIVCYEKPGGKDWCHRGIVAAWFEETIGAEVSELHHESQGSGWQHPMLPKQFRRPSDRTK